MGRHGGPGQADELRFHRLTRAVGVGTLSDGMIGNLASHTVRKRSRASEVRHFTVPVGSRNTRAMSR